MGPLMLLILAMQFFYTAIWCKVMNTPEYAVNSISDKIKDYSIFLPPELSDLNEDFLDEEDNLVDDVPLIATDEDTTEVKFRQPMESVNIDYDRNAIIAKFYKSNAKSMAKDSSIEDKSKQKSLQDNFMRFGKRSSEEFPLAASLDEGFVDKTPSMRLERSQQTARDARGDNFMRFGRSLDTKNDFMRFGRGSNDFMRFGRAAAGDNFMRFGRSANQDFMRFGRTPTQDFMRFGRTPTHDFMRFGRSASQDFMRFGRQPSQDFMRFGRSSPSQDFMRFGRTPTQDFMRFGRSSPSQDFMRFGRTPSQDFMRFGRSPSTQDFMRFGRAGQDNFMRFGRDPHQDFMRFGRSSPKIPVNTNFMRYSRPDNFMRFGRAPPQPSDNFIRFGKSLEKSNDNNTSQPIMGKSELKQAVKLIHEADKNADNGNPVDKAIKALFDKQQHGENFKDHSEQQLTNAQESSIQHDNDNNNFDSDMDYFWKMSQ